MYPPPTEARCVFIDGPVSVFIHQASEQDIADAYIRLAAVVSIAAAQLGAAHAAPTQPKESHDKPTPSGH